MLLSLKKIKRQGDTAIKNWINKQLKGTSVTVVLVGDKTCSSRWVKYEIQKSIERGNGLLGVDVSKIKDLNGNTTERCGKIPKVYSVIYGTMMRDTRNWEVGLKKQPRLLADSVDERTSTRMWDFRCDKGILL